MGNSSGIKWNGVSVGTQPTLDVIGANVQLILRDPKTQQEWVTTSQDYANFLVDNGIISSGGWELKGNAGTDPLSNFVGTTDAQALVLRSDNQALFGISAPIQGFELSTWDQLGATTDGVQISGKGSDYRLRLTSKVADYVVARLNLEQDLFHLYLQNGTYEHYLSFLPTDVKLKYNDGTVNSDLILQASGAELSSSGTGIASVTMAADGSGSIATQLDLVINASGGGNVGIGTTTPTSLLTVEDGDIEITNKNNGLIVYSQDGTAWRVSVSDLGVVTATAV